MILGTQIRSPTMNGVVRLAVFTRFESNQKNLAMDYIHPTAPRAGWKYLPHVALLRGCAPKVQEAWRFAPREEVLPDAVWPLASRGREAAERSEVRPSVMTMRQRMCLQRE